MCGTKCSGISDNDIDNTGRNTPFGTWESFLCSTPTRECFGFLVQEA